ncbi:MAG: alpha-L-fucosidase [Flavitalea sp.]
MNRIASVIVWALFISIAGYSQDSVKPPEAVLPVPSASQLQWHEMETNAFVHFTTNTFTGLEWGNGDESEKIFNPSSLDAGQWARTLKETGFKTLIFTCKHHDGFCLWPSKYTEHSVKNSSYKNGQGDVVSEVSAACKKYGLKFGVYLSPWDRNHAQYGSPDYITYYRNQLKELFTLYGPVFEMWFDGANGGTGYYGGAKETRKIDASSYYNWPVTLELVRSMQPNVIFFSDAGPDVRWVGNESGIAGETNWNTISTDTLFAGKPGIENILSTGSPDGNKWIPAEVDVSVRPGWFYHAAEDSLVKTPQQLFDIYLSSVGRGSTLLLNVPPDKRGLFHENDVKALKGFRKLVDEAFSRNLALKARASASSYRGNAATFSASAVTDNNKNTYWATDDGVTTGSVQVTLPASSLIHYVTVQEYIALGQRVNAFSIEVMKGKVWEKVFEGTTIGYKRIIKIDPVKAGAVRVNILAAKACPLISSLEVY